MGIAITGMVVTHSTFTHTHTRMQYTYIFIIHIHSLIITKNLIWTGYFCSTLSHNIAVNDGF